jgi:hypothetical protein
VPSQPYYIGARPPTHDTLAPLTRREPARLDQQQVSVAA